MIGTVIVIWICFCPLSGYLAYRVFMNRYGWGERVLTKPIGSCFAGLWSLFGPFGCIIPLVSDFRFCLMSKKEALELYDLKDLEQFGHFVGRRIAKEDGRLPEGVEVLYKGYL